MCDINESIPDLGYRIFMLELSHQITSDDIEELKYVLTTVIPEGVKERLDTTLKLFRHLEKLELVGPSNLEGLENLLRLMKKHELRAMVRSFIENNEHSLQRGQV